MSESTDEWIVHLAGPRPVPIGAVLRLMFVNGVVTNPITVGSGDSLNWDEVRSIRGVKLARNGNWRISKYQIVSLPKDSNGT